MSTPPTIDHDPDEPPIDRGPGPWRWVFPVIIAIFFLNVFTRDMDWTSLALGFGAGGVFAAWVIEITGNKVPDSWRKASRRR